MLTSLHLEKFNQGDVVQYMANLLTVLTPERAESLLLKAQCKALQAVVDRLNAAWQPVGGSEYTSQLAALDAKRDKVFSCFKVMIDAWGKGHFDTDKQNAAYQISNMIASYGKKLVKLRYQKETATINGILAKLEKDLQAEVKLLGIADWVAEIKALNTQFDATYMKRTEDVAQQNTEAVAPLIEETVATYRILTNAFNARYAVAKLDGSEAVSLFAEVAKLWNTLIKDYNDAVTQFYKSGTKSKDEEAETIAENNEESMPNTTTN